jgi:two-component system chemotaxis response regulator CheB
VAQHRDLVVIGASAGGLEPLKRLLSALPRAIDATVFVVVHASRSGESRLPAILSGAGELPAAFPLDKTPVRSGIIYVAPTDRHMTLEDSRVRVVAGPQENGRRPAIDVLFRSAAETYGPRVVGILLSGALDDGAAGLRAIKEAGGATIVQSPEDAGFPDMPEAAIRERAADLVLPLAMMPRALLRMIRGNGAGNGDEPHPARSTSPAPPDVKPTAAPPAGASPPGGPPQPRTVAPPAPGTITEPPESLFACPACGGVLWEVSESGMVRYRCHVGHAFSPESMAEENGRRADEAMWTALRVVRERVVVLRRMAEYAKQRGRDDLADTYEAQALEAKQAADVMRGLLFPA